MRRRQLFLLVGSVTSGAMAVGTGAFSSVSAERGVTMDVVGDEDAYLGIKIIDPKEHDDRIVINKEDGKTDILTLHNQFPYPISLTIWETGESSDNVSIVKFENVDIGTGHAETLAAECSADGTLILKFDAKIKDSTDQIIEAERFYDIECETSDEDGSEEDDPENTGTTVTFAGESGQVEINSGDNELPDRVTIYSVSNSKKNSDTAEVQANIITPGSEGKLQSESPSSRFIVGVEIPGIEGIFRRPQYDGCSDGLNGSDTEPVGNGNNGNNGKQDGQLITPPEDAFGSCEITDNT